MTSTNDVGEFDGPRKPNPHQLVWKSEDPWIWYTQCGRYRIMRLVRSDIREDRYSASKRAPEWYVEIGNEGSLQAAQRVCEEHLR